MCSTNLPVHKNVLYKFAGSDLFISLLLHHLGEERESVGEERKYDEETQIYLMQIV